MKSHSSSKCLKEIQHIMDGHYKKPVYIKAAWGERPCFEGGTDVGVESYDLASYVKDIFIC